MVHIILIWVLTIIMTYLMQTGIALSVLRDLANNGYKLDLEKGSNLMSEINPNGKQISNIEKLIPLYNLAKSFKMINEYTQNREFIFDQVRIMDIIEEMSEYEKNEYSKNPTALNAIVVLAKYNNLLKEAIIVEKKEAGNKIWFNLDENKKLQILKVEGPIANESIEAQKQLAIECMNKFVEKYEEEKVIQKTEKATSEKIQELRNLRSEYIDDVKSTEKENQKTKK